MKEEPAAVKLHNMPKRVTVTFVKYCGVMVVNIYIPIAAKTKATVTQNGKKKEFSTKQIKDNEHVFFIGRKVDYAISLEGSLKLKEVSYIHSEAYQAGELKHGTISLVDDGTPVISIITDKDIKEKTISNVQEVKARGAKCIIISNEEISGYDHLIQVPEMSTFFQPLVVVPCLQLIAYEVAKLRGCDIDKPKNLAKSVTVE